MRRGSIPEMTVDPILPAHVFGSGLMRRIGLNGRPYCLSFEVYRSQPVTWLDRACAVFLLQLVRCHVCLRQHYRPLHLPGTRIPHSIHDEIRSGPCQRRKAEVLGVGAKKGHANSETAQFASSSPERSPCKSETDSRMTENRAVCAASASATPILIMRPKWMEFLLTTSSQRHLNDLISFFEFHPFQQLVNGSATNTEDLGSPRFAAADCLQHAHDVTPLALFKSQERFICECFIAGGFTRAFRQIIDVD